MPLKPSPSSFTIKPFNPRLKEHKEFQSNMLASLASNEDDLRQCSRNLAREAAIAGYNAALKEIWDWIKASEGELKHTPEETLKGLHQTIERMDPDDAEIVADKDCHTQEYIAACVRQVRLNAELAVALACEDIPEVPYDDNIHNASPEALALALSDSINGATDGETIYTAQALKHGLDKAGHWRFIAELAVA